MTRPTLLLDFASAPRLVDPRASFVRASTGRFEDPLGVLRTAPANTPRWWWNPVTGAPQGVLFEPARTNLCLRSEEFDNASHTKTNLTVTANTAVGPDGATTMDTLAATATGGSVSQAVTITAGNAISVSLFLRANSVSFASCTVTDGANAVVCWFNLATGVVGTNTAGATTVLFSHATIEDYGGGLYRCTLTCTTATSTLFTVAWSPCAADNASSANGNSVFAVGEQIEAPAATSAASSYIPTTTASVTRSADSLIVPVANIPFSQTEGTLLLEWVNRRHATGNIVYGGIGDAFANTIYLTRSGASSLFMTAITASVSQSLIGKAGVALDTEGTITRAIMAWKLNDMAFTIDGQVPVADTVATVPTGPVRIGIGGTPYNAPTGSQPGVPMRRAVYWNRRLSNADMQTLTAA
jgi:hypothetical protein